MILEALAAFAKTWAKSELDRAPVLWSIHYDIWNKARGELMVDRVGDEIHQANAAFGILSPFSLVPEIGTSVLVVDPGVTLDRYPEMAVSQFTASPTGTDLSHWRATYEVDDLGRLHFGPVSKEVSPLISSVLVATVSEVVAARRAGVGGRQTSYEESVEVAIHFLEKI